MLSTATHRLTNGDLAGMDAGELREHLAYYLSARPRQTVLHARTDTYARAVADHLEAVTGIDGYEVMREALVDADGLR